MNTSISFSGMDFFARSLWISWMRIPTHFARRSRDFLLSLAGSFLVSSCSCGSLSRDYVRRELAGRGQLIIIWSGKLCLHSKQFSTILSYDSVREEWKCCSLFALYYFSPSPLSFFSVFSLPAREAKLSSR